MNKLEKIGRYHQLLDLLTAKLAARDRLLDQIRKNAFETRYKAREEAEGAGRVLGGHWDEENALALVRSAAESNCEIGAMLAEANLLAAEIGKPELLLA